MRVIRTTALLAALAWASSAAAHAFLEHANPPVGSTVHGSLARVDVWFSQDLEPAFSTLKVFDASGKQVDKMDKSVAASERTRMTVSLPPLAPGKYRVVWRALSVDTHVTEGDFTFELAP